MKPNPNLKGRYQVILHSYRAEGAQVSVTIHDKCQLSSGFIFVDIFQALLFTPEGIKISLLRFSCCPGVCLLTMSICALFIFVTDPGSFV